jgi:hypothetical protein
MNLEKHHAEINERDTTGHIVLVHENESFRKDKITETKSRLVAVRDKKER